MTISKEEAIRLFVEFDARGWAVALKHRRGEYSVEIPTGLIGDPAYRREESIARACAGMACKVEVTHAGTTRIS
jgi:hypothetical protein